MEDATKGTSSFMLFVVLAYGALWGLFGLGTWLAIPFSMDPRTPVGVFYLIGAALPSSCAIVAVLVCEGWTGLRRLMQRSLVWRFSPFLYLAAILIPFMVTGTNAMIAMWLMGRSAPPQWFVPAFGPGFLLFFLVYNGFGEEIGWRGLALPVLRRHLGSLGGNIAVGVLWALWHLPLFWLRGSYQYGDSIILFVVLLTCWSIRAGGAFSWRSCFMRAPILSFLISAIPVLLTVIWCGCLRLFWQWRIYRNRILDYPGRCDGDRYARLCSASASYSFASSGRPRLRQPAA